MLPCLCWKAPEELGVSFSFSALCVSTKIEEEKKTTPATVGLTFV